MHLSKSLYTTGLDCEKKMVHRARGDASAELDPGSLHRMRIGKEIGELARQLYPTGVLVESKGLAPEEAAQATAQVLSKNPDVVFEATFTFGRLTARVDILRRTPGGWEIVEVKSSKSVKTAHRQDVAFQAYVARQSGINVTGFHVIVLNEDYVLQTLNPVVSELFKESNVAKAVETYQEALSTDTDRFIKLLDGESYPESPMDKNCRKCEFFSHCEPRMPEDDVAYLYFPARNQITKLREIGKTKLWHLGPEDTKNDIQARQLIAIREQQDWLDNEALRGLLQLSEPIHFIDFETIMPAVPRWPGTKPYFTVPFQWSNHILENGVVRHEEFIHRGEDNPAQAFTTSLLRSLKGAATIVVYSSFEEQRVKNLDALGFEGANLIKQALENRQVDLLQIIREHTYFRGYQGSFSIKTVLPTLVPTLSYSDLAIQGGDVASALYAQVATMTEADATKTINDLLAYCKRDTEAMVEIYRKLQALCELD